MDEFNNYVAPSTLLVRFDSTPSVLTLQATEGVKEVEHLDRHCYRIKFGASKTFTEQIVQQRDQRLATDRDSTRTTIA